MTNSWYIFQQDTTAAEEQVTDSLQTEVPLHRKNEYARREVVPYLNPLDDSEIVTFQEEPAPRLILPAREKTPVNTDWLAIVIFGTIVIFATIRYSYVNYIKHLFTSLLNYPTAVRLLQESSYPASHAAYRLDAIFYIVFSIFIFQVLNVFGIVGSSNQFLFFLMVAAAVLLYFFGKRFLYHLVGTLFETKSETGEYLFNMSNFNRALGIILIPMVALVSFSPIKDPRIVVFAGIAIILAFNLTLLQRGVIILLKKQFSILYLFLYLCTLEFLPLLLIYKVVVVE